MGMTLQGLLVMPHFDGGGEEAFRNAVSRRKPHDLATIVGKLLDAGVTQGHDIPSGH